MTTYTQKGSVTVEAFHWQGGTLAAAASTLPSWAKSMALHTPGDGTLHVPVTAGGTLAAHIGDWVVRYTNGIIVIIDNATFTALYS